MRKEERDEIRHPRGGGRTPGRPPDFKAFRNKKKNTTKKAPGPTVGLPPRCPGGAEVFSSQTVKLPPPKKLRCDFYSRGALAE